VVAPETLPTPRLLLRKPVLSDVEAVIREYAHDPEVTRYLLWPPDQTPGEIGEFLSRAIDTWQRGTIYTWAITLKESSRLIGMIDARLDAYMVNVGYVLGREHWNRGYTTEALKAVITWAEGLETVERIWAVCAVANPASARVMEKAGMEREGILRKWLIFPNCGGTPLDCYCYARVRGVVVR
jgi:RimJ/RimL family protein N-acetyltransferase